MNNLFDGELNEEDGFLCLECWDKGMVLDKSNNTMIVCPYCKSKNVFLTVEDHVAESEKEKIRIPKVYMDMSFEMEKLKNSPLLPQIVKENGGFLLYASYLKDIYEKYLTNSQLVRSLFISADQGSGKSSFVYSCINAAIKSGRTVAPYWDTGEIYKKVKARNTAKEDKGEDQLLESIFTSDTCFMKMQVGLTSNRDTQTIKLVVDRRARNGLATIVMSRVPFYYLNTIEAGMEAMFRSDFRDIEEYDYSKFAVIEGPSAYKSNKNRGS